MNISWILTRAAQFWPGQSAVVHDGRAVTFLELERRTNRLANALRALGLEKGERVAMQAWNCIELVEIECALYKAGLVKAPVNARLSPHEVDSVLEDSGAVALISSSEHLARLSGEPHALRHRIALGPRQGEWLSYEDVVASGAESRPRVEIRPDDVAVLHYTSGSTGRLKAAAQTYGNRLAGMNNVLLARYGAAGEGDRMALFGPLTHASGKLVQPLFARGATAYIYSRYDPEGFLQAVERDRITHTFLVPTMIQMLLAHPALGRYDLSSLRSLSFGAAPMSPALIREAWERIGPVLAQGYGAGETTGGVTHMSTAEYAHALAHRPQRLLSCGRAFGEALVRVVDDNGDDVSGDAIGEIVVAGRNVIQGYWRAPDISAENIKDGWWHSGDLARVDDEGFITIVDRKKDMIISGGFNVYTTEVEQALFSHPAVAEVCVFGVPDERWGEAVHAAVARRPGHEGTTAEELIAHCEHLVSGFKKPRGIDFLPELPKNQNGKIARNELRKPHWAGRQRNVN